MDDIEEKMLHLLLETKRLSGGSEDERTLAREIRYKLETILQLPILSRRIPGIEPKIKEYLKEKLADDLTIWNTLLGWLFVHALGKVVSRKDFPEVSRSWIDEWRLGKVIKGVLGELGLDDTASWELITIIKLLTSHQGWFEEKNAYQVLVSLLKDNEVQQFLQINRYNDILWFNREAFDDLLWWLMMLAAVEISSDLQRPANRVAKDLEDCYGMVQNLKDAKEKSGYQVEKLLELLR
jgi:hypothetical protein